MTDVELVPLTDDDMDAFITENQEAFRFGAVEEFGLRDDHLDDEGEIISRSTIERSIAEGTAYRIVSEGRRVGGLVVKVKDTHGELELLFVSPKEHSKGIGHAAWCAIENMYPDVTVWETVTPYFEKRNIHFYVNKCGFRIVEFYNEFNKGPDSKDHDDEGPDEMFRFVKEIRR